MRALSFSPKMLPVFAKALYLTLRQFGRDPRVAAPPFLVEIKGAKKAALHKFSSAGYQSHLPTVTWMS